MTKNEIRALSIAGPFAYLIATGWKSIELRSWKTRYRGTVLLHASTGRDFDWLFDESGFPSVEDCPKKALIGAATLVDCITYSDAKQWQRDIKRHRWLHLEETYEQIRQDYYGGKPPIGHVLDNPILFEPPILDVPGAFQYWTPKKPAQIAAFKRAAKALTRIVHH